MSCDSGTQHDDKTTRLLPETAILDHLNEQKAQIDSLFRNNSKNIEVYAAVLGEQIPRKILKQDFPENVTKTYNLLRDSTSRLITVSEFPFSQSGDWNIILTHYFDKQGKTFAFERQTNFFNSMCAEIAFENITEFYSSDFNRIDSIYNLYDQENNELERENCQFPYDFQYNIVKDSDSFLKREKIENGR